MSVPTPKTLYGRVLGLAPLADDLPLGVEGPRRPTLAKTTKLVGYTIGAHMDGMGRARPGMARVGAQVGVSARTARAHVTILETFGLLRATRSGGRGLANRYQATIPPWAWALLFADGVDSALQAQVEGEYPEAQTSTFRGKAEAGNGKAKVSRGYPEAQTSAEGVEGLSDEGRSFEWTEDKIRILRKSWGDKRGLTHLSDEELIDEYIRRMTAATGGVSA